VLPSNSLIAYWISGPAAARAAVGIAMTTSAVSLWAGSDSFRLLGPEKRT
jgi:hypothetical protein